MRQFMWQFNQIFYHFLGKSRKLFFLPLRHSSAQRRPSTFLQTWTCWRHRGILWNFKTLSWCWITKQLEILIKSRFPHDESWNEIVKMELSCHDDEKCSLFFFFFLCSCSTLNCVHILLDFICLFLRSCCRRVPVSCFSKIIKMFSQSSKRDDERASERARAASTNEENWLLTASREERRGTKCEECRWKNVSSYMKMLWENFTIFLPLFFRRWLTRADFVYIASITLARAHIDMRANRDGLFSSSFLLKQHWKICHKNVTYLFFRERWKRRKKCLSTKWRCRSCVRECARTLSVM